MNDEIYVEVAGARDGEGLPRYEDRVSALPAEELYFTLLDVGADDAAELVAMATPEQFRHFDLGVIGHLAFIGTSFCDLYFLCSHFDVGYRWIYR